MRTAIGNYKNEIRKLRARKKYYVFLILEILVCIVWGLISILISKASNGYIDGGFMLAGMNMTTLGFFIEIYIPLIIFMAACDVYTSEIHDGTIRAIFMRPVSRLKLYFSKVAAVMTVATVYLVILFVITTMMQIIGAKSIDGIFTAFMSYFLDLIPMLILVLFAAMINQFVSSTSLSVILCIIMYIGLYAFGVVVPQAGSLLFTGLLMWHKMWVGIMLPFGVMVSKLGMLVGYGMVFGCIGYYLFERREV